MKKIFIALSVVAVLAFMVAPSSALVGIDDAVPGTDILQPFFIVSIPGVGTQDTLIVIQEIGSLGGPLSTPTGAVHWTIYDRRSIHRGDYTFRYSHFDVLPYSILWMLQTYVSSTNLAALEVDLDEDGVNDHYVGYIYWDNNNDTADNLVAYQYQIDLINGMAAGVAVPAKEYAPTSMGYDVRQQDDQVAPIGDGYESFSPNALAVSDWREYLNTVPPAAWDVGWFSIYERFFLLNDSAVSWMIIWTTKAPFVAPNINLPGALDVIVYNEDEVGVSVTIPFLYELNIINVAGYLPGSWVAPVGGWFDIMIPDINGATSWAGWQDEEFLAYSYQTASSPTASINWGALFTAHRESGTLMP